MTLSVAYDEPSKHFLLHKLRCAYCGAEGVELTSLVMYHFAPVRNNVHSLICVPCNRLIRTGGKPTLVAKYPREAEVLGGRGLLYNVTIRMRLNEH